MSALLLAPRVIAALLEVSARVCEDGARCRALHQLAALDAVAASAEAFNALIQRFYYAGRKL